MTFYDLRSKVGRLFLSLYLCLSDLLYRTIPSAKILLYHRVDELKSDPHKLAVEQQNFKRQIYYLSKNYNIVFLNDLYEKIIARNVRKKTLVITFDDGYFDNYSKAFPILEKYNVPATIFVTTELKSGSTKTILNDRKGIKKMKKHGLISIGCHTQHHKKLSTLNIREQTTEIKDNKIFLEKIVKERLSFFAYPYGQRTDFNNTTVNLVKKMGFKLALTAYPGIVTIFSNRFKLPRYVVKNWNLKTFKRKTGL